MSLLYVLEGLYFSCNPYCVLVDHIAGPDAFSQGIGIMSDMRAHHDHVRQGNDNSPKTGELLGAAKAEYPCQQYVYGVTKGVIMSLDVCDVK